ncbi:MAG: TRIC cation channel family protein [Sphaerochaetaceae bacterium]|nr:TRIC cation channel family protein [Sphaerochaetaceae bacterium]
MDFVLFGFLEISGAISSAISGSLVACRKKMDYFGVIFLGIITAVGGGATRDLIIGQNPPIMFIDPIYVIVAFIVSTIVFIFIYYKINAKTNTNLTHVFETVLFWFDTFGLASFTANGVIIGQTLDTQYGLFLSAFLGVITGVGGGILRDLLAGEVPAIFVKHIYALASIVGAVAICLLWSVVNEVLAVIIGLALIIIIRVLARHYKWNLPRISG